MKLHPVIDLFWNPKTQVFSILRYAVDPRTRFTIGFGKFVKLSAKQIEDQGIELILPYLREFDSNRPLEKSELENISPAAWQRFRRDHRMVQVGLPSENQISLDATRPDKGGWVSAEEDPLLVKLPVSNSVFYPLLIGAFLSNRKRK